MPDVQLSHDQVHAIELCLSVEDRIVGITGGAGTGKTTIMKEVYKQLKAKYKTVTLCAPTGRAAKRIQEATGQQASTIHKLLEFPQPGDEEDLKVKGKVMRYWGPKRNAYNPIEFDYILVDESSMVSQELYDQLMAAMRKSGSIRFFGDNNQLPPVEEDARAVSPFKNILRRFPSVTLNFNFRSEDHIVSNSLRILRNQMPERNAGFEILYTQFPMETLIDYALSAPDFKKAEHQIIMPTRKGNLGTIRANPRLQLKYNPNGPALQLDRFNFDEPTLRVRKHDKFLWTKNDYNLNFFNGEIGSIYDLSEYDGSLELRTPDRDLHVPAQGIAYIFDRKVPYDPRKQIDLGYAVTTHKSQGSEFETIIYCVTGHQPFMLNRNNFYTAITRAKKHVTMITDRTGMARSMRPLKV